MKQVVIISGKGGTGKTVISACFATLPPQKVMADADVDAANLHILLDPMIQETHAFSGGSKAQIDPQACTGCGECKEVCRFDAVEEGESGFRIDPLYCEGCSVCSHICPVEAITMEPGISGHWFVSQTQYGPFVHAKLGAGEENSGKLVTEVRKKAKDIAQEKNLSLVVIDGPPGIGCPVIASLSGTDLALVVTEPSLSGIHDMQRVIRMAQHFRTQTACCINKYDLNLQQTARIERWCEEESVPILGKIPYDEAVIESLTRMIPLTESEHSPAGEMIKSLWRELDHLIKE